MVIRWIAHFPFIHIYLINCIYDDEQFPEEGMMLRFIFKTVLFFLVNHVLRRVFR